MTNFRLEPADILVNINRRHDPFSALKRWAVGPYEHVFLYMGMLGLFSTRAQRRIIRVPMLFESNGRGVVLQSLSNRYGQEVTVMRLKSEFDRRRISRVLEEAINLASHPQSYYDYYAIAVSVLPRIICEKFHLAIPIAWQRDAWQICSEAVYEVFVKARLFDILPSWRVPLPGDYVDSILLEEVCSDRLSEEMV